MKIFYQVVGGSRSYGLQTERSDIDVLCVTDAACKTCSRDGPYNLIQVPVEDFFPRSMMSGGFHDYLQWLFPEKFNLENELASYVKGNREQIVLAQLPGIFRGLYEYAEAMREYADRIYKSLPKRMTYSTLFYSVLANYAEGMPFARAHRPGGELHDFLIGMRLGRVPLKEAAARNELERLRAEKAEGFYRQAVHPEILREFERVIQEEAERGG